MYGPCAPPRGRSSLSSQLSSQPHSPPNKLINPPHATLLKPFQRFPLFWSVASCMPRSDTTAHAARESMQPRFSCARSACDNDASTTSPAYTTSTPTASYPPLRPHVRPPHPSSHFYCPSSTRLRNPSVDSTVDIDSDAGRSLPEAFREPCHCFSPHSTASTRPSLPAMPLSASYQPATERNATSSRLRTRVDRASVAPPLIDAGPSAQPQESRPLSPRAARRRKKASARRSCAGEYGAR